jgi:hypothetical protein
MHASTACLSVALHERTNLAAWRSMHMSNTAGDGDAAPSDLATEVMPGSVATAPWSMDVAR